MHRILALITAPAIDQATKYASHPKADEQRHYLLALKTRDAQFDEHFFNRVVTTGIYCRPVCKVHTPKQANCRFFALAAQAEAVELRH